MLNKHMQVPKNQYPNVIKKSYKDVYLLSLQEKILRYHKLGFKNDIDEPVNAMIPNKRFFTKIIEVHKTTQKVRETVGFCDPVYNWGTCQFIYFSSPTKAFKHLLSLSEIKDLPPIIYNYKEHSINNHHFMVYEENDYRGNPSVVYNLYQVEALQKGNLKNAIIPYGNNDIFNQKPSVINHMMNWKPKTFLI